MTRKELATLPLRPAGPAALGAVRVIVVVQALQRRMVVWNEL